MKEKYMLSKKEIMIISIRTERMFGRLNIKRNFKAYLFSLIFLFLSFYIFGIIDNNKVLK